MRSHAPGYGGTHPVGKAQLLVEERIGKAHGLYVYHVLNQANARLRLFKKVADFAAFENFLAEAHDRVPLRIAGYTPRGNHWHSTILVPAPQA